MKNTASLPFTDDHGIPCAEMRYLPYCDGGNILVSHSSYWKEIHFRKERAKTGVPFEFPEWNSLKIYSVE